jgi:DNA-binding CsgD family transcriptional regulator
MTAMSRPHSLGIGHLASLTWIEQQLHNLMARKDYNLTPKQDRAVRLAMKGHSFRTAAEALNMAPSDLRKLLARAAGRLRKLKSRPSQTLSK